MRRVVVTGLGTVSPCGNDVPTTWTSLLEGRSGVGPITHFDATDWAVQIAAEVKGFDPLDVMTKKQVRRLDLFSQYAIAAADEAMHDAGLADGGTEPERLGVYVGSGIGGIKEIFESAVAFIEHGPRGLSPFFIPKSLTNLAGGHIALRFGARGPSLCVTTACATGNHSIGEAWRTIRSGEAEVILAGGTEASVMPLGLAGFMVMRALSTRNDDPETASRPFDVDRDGFVMGEGAAVLVLEELEHAKARGAEIYAEVVGYGLTNDAHHVTAPPPGGEGAARCMKMALRTAEIAPGEIQYINAHGTSTPANDVNETAAIKTVFGEHASRLAISSTKSLTGHLLGAAGGLEAIATVKAIRQGVIPPTATLQEPDPQCDLDYVPREAREMRVDAAISNAFGFGGTNATLVFRRFQE